MANRLRFSARAAYAHLSRADPVVGELIEQHGPYAPRPGSEPYASLVRAILYQQLAGPAARAIQRRFYLRYGDDEERTPTPEEILGRATRRCVRPASRGRRRATCVTSRSTAWTGRSTSRRSRGSRTTR